MAEHRDDENERRVPLEQVALTYGVSMRTAKRWLAEGMPHERLGPRTLRLRMSEVRAWLAQRQQSEGGQP
jgi:predicted DNA-binding transcriptional regulator AlpA